MSEKIKNVLLVAIPVFILLVGILDTYIGFHEVKSPIHIFLGGFFLGEFSMMCMIWMNRG